MISGFRNFEFRLKLNGALGMVGIPNTPSVAYRKEGVTVMAEYRLTDCYDERKKTEYNLPDLDIFWGKVQETLPNKDKHQDVDTAHEKFGAFLVKHGKTHGVVKFDKVYKQLKTDLFHRVSPFSSDISYEEKFAYLQLLLYILELSAKNGVKISEFLSLIDNPSQNNMPLYDEILADISPFISDDMESRSWSEDVKRQMNAVWNTYECFILGIHTARKVCSGC